MRSFPLRLATGAAATVGILALGAGSALAADTYEVQPGDTLSGIAGELDAVGTWRELADANDKIQDPNLIFPGQVLALPGSEAAASSGSPEPAPAPAPEPEPAPEPTGTVDRSVWDRLAQCESSGDWSINTGNGYYGGLQFALSSWEWVGGTGYPHEASKDEQIARAEILLERQGWEAWPACSKQLGLR